jgi:hypothetical protein
VKTLETAIVLAAKAHAGQVDKIGRPFILHPLRLMLRAEAAPAGLAEMVLAVLHDVVEDCTPLHGNAALTLAEKIGMKEALLAVTRREGETYFEHIRRAKMIPAARRVKILDVEDHIREAHTAELRGMVKTRYAKALRILRGEEE